MATTTRERRVLGRRVVVEGEALDAPLYAINWFDTRDRRAYDLYNKLAAPAVGAVGGRGHLKARRLETLEGTDDRARDTLLIVSYPGADAFLRMATSPYFLAISPLRERGVQRFVFGFTRRVDGGPAPAPRPRAPGADRLALVHHFEADEPSTLEKAAPALADAADRAGARLHYAGARTARLGVARGEGPTRHAPFFIDGIVAVVGPAERMLRAFVDSDAMRSLRGATRAHYTGIFERAW